MFNFFGFRNMRRSRNLIYNLVPYERIREIINDTENNIVIDVRNKNEYDIIHVVNSVNIPLSKLRMCENEYKQKKRIILYCSTGVRTKEAIRILNNMGYYDLFIWEYGALSNFPYKDMLKF